jgi:hypothetical protein
VFASASTFTIAGVDRTATFTPGTRLKFTNSTVKFAVVVSSAFAVDTTVTIAVNTDYVIANAAISSPFFSYQGNPQGYPGWFNFTSVLTGWAATPTLSRFVFAVNGRLCSIDMRATGTSNSTGTSCTAPIACATTADGQAQNIGPSTGADNGTSITTPARCTIGSASSTITFTKDYAGAVWTNTGTKTVSVTGNYQI